MPFQLLLTIANFNTILLLQCTIILWISAKLSSAKLALLLSRITYYLIIYFWLLFSDQCLKYLINASFVFHYLVKVRKNQKISYPVYLPFTEKVNFLMVNNFSVKLKLVLRSWKKVINQDSWKNNWWDKFDIKFKVSKLKYCS